LYRQSKLATACCAIALGLGATTAAAAAKPGAEAHDQPAGGSIAADHARLHRIVKPKRRHHEPAQEFGLAGGVSQATLDAIGACESGGDPTAVDASGTYYGKYQFDLGTWASVGGSGSPADASEAEQDYRASVLYSRAGSSPWPVCGV
jgi:hypothetical protein